MNLANILVLKKMMNQYIRRCVIIVQTQHVCNMLMLIVSMANFLTQMICNVNPVKISLDKDLLAAQHPKVQHPALTNTSSTVKILTKSVNHAQLAFQTVINVKIKNPVMNVMYIISLTKTKHNVFNVRLVVKNASVKRYAQSVNQGSHYWRTIPALLKCTAQTKNLES